VANLCQNDPIVPCCEFNADCDDGDKCTDDRCVGNLCQNDPIVPCCEFNADCDDGDKCTDDRCVGNLCQNDPIVACCEFPSDCPDKCEDCVGNVCTPIAGCCEFLSDCPDKCEDCVGNVCTPIAGCCEFPSDCPDKCEDCVGNVCVPIAGCCVTSAGCGTCERCENNVCVDGCGDAICDPACGEDCKTCPVDCLPPTICKAATGNACVMGCDDDNDGIENNIDPFPLNPSNEALDTSNTPDTVVSLVIRGHQEVCASDARCPDGITVQLVGGHGAFPHPCAKPQLLCNFVPTMNACLYFGVSGSVTWTCKSSTIRAIAEAVGGDVDLELLKGGVVVATLVLPEGNTIIYKPETLEVTAPASNNSTLILVNTSGEQLALAPGETRVLTLPIPALSEWGIGVMALLLLIGAKVYFNRRRAIQA
jgi:hypothetical protein